jgi:N-acyl-D-aspartate/D-glutamate deacylase
MSSMEDKHEIAMHDLVIRGATVVDGLGNDPISADVAIRDGRIVAIGEVGKDAPEIVDAGGLALMPGIIDLHPHYDAQVTWDPIPAPSPSLGVTTAIMGNCGFGIVPSPPQLRDLIMRNLAVVEGMDLDALRAGIDGRFQSFAEKHDDAARARPLHEPPPPFDPPLYSIDELRQMREVMLMIARRQGLMPEEEEGGSPAPVVAGDG